MNVLNPDLVWIESRCYRINDTKTAEVTEFQENDLYEQETNYNDVEDEDEEDIPLTKLNESRYSTSMHVSKHYIGHIIGRKGAIKMRIEHDTRTEIKIPRHGDNGDIVIMGATPSNVKAAYRRINIIVISSRMKQRPTHFVSIPMNSPNIQERFNEFKASVLHECIGIDETLFNKPEKLHATVGVMCLMDNEERMMASKLFTESKNTVVMPLLQAYLPYKVRVKGISYMNDNPKEIDVLYALIEDTENGLMKKLCDGLVDFFYKSGFMPKEFEREHVKLHITVMNSKFKSKALDKTDSDQTWNKKRPPRVAFDGSQVLDKFADYDFGFIELKEIHLSQLYSTGEDGYYQSTCVISLP